MVVAGQAQVTPETPEQVPMPRRQRVVWPKPSQLRRSAPILRLLAEIWAVPQVTKVGLMLRESDVHIWVFMPEDDRAAESKISAAERAYLNATTLHGFELDVVPTSVIREDVLPPYEVVLER